MPPSGFTHSRRSESACPQYPAVPASSLDPVVTQCDMNHGWMEADRETTHLVMHPPLRPNPPSEPPPGRDPRFVLPRGNLRDSIRNHRALVAQSTKLDRVVGPGEEHQRPPLVLRLLPGWRPEEGLSDRREVDGGQASSHNAVDVGTKDAAAKNVQRVAYVADRMTRERLQWR